MYKRIVVSLAVVVLASLCVSCSTDVSNAPPHDTSGNTVAENDPQPDPPDADDASDPGGPVSPSIEDFSPTADNPLGGCTQCHVDVEDAMAGTSHLKEGVGCKVCHGDSEGHLADENNEVLPEHVFTRENVDQLCINCHDCSRPQQKTDPSVPAEQRKACTDCHQAHTIQTGKRGRSSFCRSKRAATWGVQFD